MAGCQPAEELREDALLDFLAESGGRAKNKALVERFKAFINAAEPQLRAKYRDIFKDIVNKIAVVKQEDGEKYIILKKKYQHLVQEKGSNSKEEKMISNTPVQASFEQTLEKDQPVNFGEEKQPGSLSDVQPFMPKSQNEAPEIGRLSSAVITTPVKVNACEWIVPDLPTTHTMSQAPSEITSDSQGNPGFRCSEVSEEKQDEKFDVASENNAANPVNIEIKVEEAQQEFDSLLKDDLEQNGFEDGTGSMGSPSVALDPLEKEWLKCAAIGHLTALCDLLRQDPSLAMKKTALHWAAKHGKENMARMLINAGVDINLRAGYTPLHIAALHSHLDIMDLLIHNYGAKTNVRDYSGRFASHYLKDNDDPTDHSDVSSKFQQSRGDRRNRKLAELFLPKSYGSSKKNWGSVENLTSDDKDGSIFLSVPTSYKAVRKFSR